LKAKTAIKPHMNKTRLLGDEFDQLAAPGEDAMKAGNSHILVVDDHATNRLKMSMAVKQLGHETDVAEDGESALEKLRGGRFDLVLLDIEMPRLDGYAVLESMKEDASLRDIPVIVISAVDEMENVVKAIELGAQDFLPNNFDRVLFKARVGACLEKKRLRDQEANHLRQIEFERKRADDLLHATLPAAAVEELKSTNEVRPRRFEEVVVMLTDIAGFTAYCEARPPEEVVGHLQDLVNAFEEISKRHGLEKIKTIGDAFMVTAGLLQPVSEPSLAAVRCGLEMAGTAPRLAAGWQVRVGLHVGPVVAGVIGRQQHLFDLWGDTVNTAARLTDIAEPGCVYLSEAAWRQVGPKGRGVSKGIVELKGRGGLEVIECTGLKEE